MLQNPQCTISKHYETRRPGIGDSRWNRSVNLSTAGWTARATTHGTAPLLMSLASPRTLNTTARDCFSPVVRPEQPFPPPAVAQLAASQAAPEPLAPIRLPDESSSDSAVCTSELQEWTPLTVHQPTLDPSHAFVTQIALKYAGLAACLCVLRLVIRQRAKSRARGEPQEMLVRQQRRAHRSPRARTTIGMEEQDARHQPPALRELKNQAVVGSFAWNASVPSLYSAGIASIREAAEVSPPKAAVSCDFTERELLETLKVPALWELIFAESIIPSPSYAQAEAEAAARISVPKDEDAAHHFRTEQVAYSVYGVVSDGLEACTALGVDEDVVWAWLAEREEARSWEQGTELGIVWDCPPRANV